MKKLIIIFVIFAVGAGIVIANIQEKRAETKTEEKPIAKVYISIDSEDKTILNQVRSYLLRELREIKDVQVVDNRSEADYAYVLVMVAVIVDNTNIGYGVSYALIQPNIIEEWMDSVFAECTESFDEETKQYFESSLVYLTSGVRLISKDNLESIKSLITDLDIHYLEPERQQKRKVKKILKESNEQKTTE